MLRWSIVVQLLGVTSIALLTAPSARADLTRVVEQARKVQRSKPTDRNLSITDNEGISQEVIKAVPNVTRERKLRAQRVVEDRNTIANSFRSGACVDGSFKGDPEAYIRFVRNLSDIEGDLPQTIQLVKMLANLAGSTEDVEKSASVRKSAEQILQRGRSEYDFAILNRIFIMKPATESGCYDVAREQATKVLSAPPEWYSATQGKVRQDLEEISIRSRMRRN